MDVKVEIGPPERLLRLTCVRLIYTRRQVIRLGGSYSNVVRKERLELSRVTPLEPKSSASTNSATFAWQAYRDRDSRSVDPGGSIALK
jgi:hypothetical protein